MNPDIELLDIKSKKISGIVDLIKFKNLIKIYCSNNQITQLDNLPSKLTVLNCINNQINQLINLPTSLDNLPSQLVILYCSNNQLTTLDNLPQTLNNFVHNNNKIKII